MQHVSKQVMDGSLSSLISRASIVAGDRQATLKLLSNVQKATCYHRETNNSHREKYK